MNVGIVEYPEVLRGIKVELEFAEEAEPHLFSFSQPGLSYWREESPGFKEVVDISVQQAYHLMH